MTARMKTRACVFCGASPDKKTIEHVLPRWLIRATGDPKEPVPLGVDRKTGKARFFPFDKLVLPSCQECNQRFGELENQARDVVFRVFDRAILSEHEVNVLMDWLDKVRIGLWLWQLSMDGPGNDFRPKFRIDSRLAAKDRLVFVLPLQNDLRGLGFYGTNTMAFLRSPSCFALAANNTAFLNVSFDYFLSNRLGFPYLQDWYALGADKPEFGLLQRGTGKVRPPMMPGRLRGQGVAFGQCIFDPQTDERAGTDYYSDGHLLGALSEITGRSVIFAGHEDTVEKLSELDHDLLHPDMPIANRITYKPWLILEVYKIQSDIINLWPKSEWVDEEMRANVERYKEEALSELTPQIRALDIVHAKLGGLVV